MAILIDAAIFIDCERGKLDLAKIIDRGENHPLFIAVVTASELLHGLHRATDPNVKSKRESLVESII